MGILLLAVSILPVILLMLYIYKQDKYEKEPLGLLLLAFFGGILAIPMDLILVYFVNSVYYSETVFYSAFIEAGFCEELCKFCILMLFIWRNKNFNEYMDGIVYATFVGLGFACVENIMYVFEGGLGTGIMRGLLSVPGHFLFAVVMGYFLSMAKFHKEKRGTYLLLSLFGAVLAHGLFDWMLMITDVLPPAFSIAIFVIFIWADIKLWKVGMKYIRQHRESSQFKEPEFKQIDWNAGNQE